MRARRLRSACGRTGCGELAEPGESLCPAHRGTDRSAYFRQIGSAAERGYGEEWGEIRRVFLAQHPTCVSCGGPAVVVDHVTPRVRGSRIDRGGQDADGNLQALCRRCHARKTVKFDGGYGNPRVG